MPMACAAQAMIPADPSPAIVTADSMLPVEALLTADYPPLPPRSAARTDEPTTIDELPPEV
jgi:hypothetical protein